MVGGLAKVDDYCGKLHIGIVKINDLELVTEYNLGELPALVYYRHGVPILYEGETFTINMDSWTGTAMITCECQET